MLWCPHLKVTLHNCAPTNYPEGRRIVRKCPRIYMQILINVDDRMGSCALPVLMMFANRRREWCGPVLIVLNDQTRECACPASCRDKGRICGRVRAWCLS